MNDVERAAAQLTETAATELALYESNSPTESFIALFSVLEHTALTSLRLTDCDMRDEGAIALAAVLPRTRLTTLVLDECRVRRAGVQALAMALCQSQLTRLDLPSNYLHTDVLLAFAEVPAATELRELNLASNALGGAGAALQALLMCPALGKLHELNLGDNPLGASDVAALCGAAPRLRQLRVLDLAGSMLRDEGVAALLDALSLAHAETAMRSLGLSECGIEAAGVADIARRALEGTRLVLLDLSANVVGDEGAAALARALPLSRLLALDVSSNGSVGTAGNGIGADGMCALAQALPRAPLEQLHAYGEPLGVRETAELRRALPGSALRVLYVCSPEEDLSAHPALVWRVAVDSAGVWCEESAARFPAAIRSIVRTLLVLARAVVRTCPGIPTQYALPDRTCHALLQRVPTAVLYAMFRAVASSGYFEMSTGSADSL